MDLDHCRFCGKELSTGQKEYAHKVMYPLTCSSECARKDVVRRFACCEKATLNPCVCARSFKCPVHGVRCSGTHD